ncbi:hypothetical protein [Methanolobus sp. WCC4]|uniref:hypothetical protein n=1 Tax=Methanolobus sp. WCC4 TaxID=3125784 RepID=UPI0030F84F05
MENMGDKGDMDKRIPMLIAGLVVVVFVGMAGAYVLLDPGDASTSISGSQAIGIVMSNPNASEYYSQYFKVPDRRVNATTLVDSSPDGSTSEEGIWKVEIMERTCYCSGVKDLYVIEGYVSASDGEIFEISTGEVSESEYDKKTCSSTSCH